MRTLLSLVLCTAVSSFAMAQELTLMITPSQVNGNQITYDVSAANFTDMVGVQYAMVYDPAEMTFVSLENLNLPDLDAGDFNTNIAGSIRHAWIETALEGVTLNDGEVIYQIVMEVEDGAVPELCFSEDPMVAEFVQPDLSLLSYMIMDDCHSEPFIISLSTSVDDLAEKWGIQINTMASGQFITFRANEPQRIGFTLLDLSGKVVHNFSTENWPVGPHGLYFKTPLVPGMYVLSVEVGAQVYGVKVWCQE